jgi:inner membrane protein
MPDALERTGTALRNSQMLRLLSVVALALMLLIPVMMIGGLVRERQGRRGEVITEVSSSWGNRQVITGPALVVPYTHRWTETSSRGETIVHTTDQKAIFLPRELHAQGTIEAENLHRGIFNVPVYKLHLNVEGEFDAPDLAALDPATSSIDWDKASLIVGISDVRAIQQQTAVSWNGDAIPFLPGAADFAASAVGIHAVVGARAGKPGFRFSFPLVLNGSAGVDLAPFGQTTRVELRSASARPSFQGKWLPVQRSVSDAGFSATWDIPYLGRNYPQAWTSASNMSEAIDGSRFGVDLAGTVDHYRMADRSVKYAGLFILLTFVCVWLIEVLAGVRVHPIQYLLLGAALCLFYLLELSLSEHLGFALAFVCASLAVIGLVTGYAWVIFHRRSRTLLVAGGVAGLYTYLYVLLTNEDFALLVGSIALFVILATVMFVTRRIDWFTVGTGTAKPTEAT